ncbi:MAG TPA: hypothetical protein VIB08_00925 [Thermoanaerobaculia bacterium]
MRESRPLSPRARRTAAIAGGILIAAIAGWVVTLPMRQTRFQIVEHRLETSAEGVEVRGRLRNRGADAPAVLLEAYLYDDRNRWLGTAAGSLTGVPADSTVPFAIPIEPALARNLERYSLYAGLEPNPLAPGM